MKPIMKFDYITGELLQQYYTIQQASEDNNLSYITIYKMLQQDIIKQPRRDYYFGYEPKKRQIIVCYDNETREELGRYKNIKDASEKTGVAWQQIEWQIRCNRDFNDRYMGSTGLWFKRITICN